MVPIEDFALERAESAVEPLLLGGEHFVVVLYLEEASEEGRRRLDGA
jgi:hypothetical protein